MEVIKKAYFDIKKFTYKYKLGGTCTQTYCEAPSAHRPQSEQEARQQCVDWIMKKHKSCVLLDLKIEFKK